MEDLTVGGALREAVRDATIAIPGVPHALAARLAEREGYDALYLSGAALSAGVLGEPDVGRVSRAELVQQTGYICRSSRLPLVVDADTGFGGPDEVACTVAELEAAGAAAIQIEDQQSPKRCGHLEGKSLIAPEEMAEKIRAAADARIDCEFVIVARTDAADATGIEDAILRARRYLDAGADWIFPEALQSREQFESFADSVDAPLVANMTEFGKSPLFSVKELAELGYAVALYPVTLLRISMKAIEMALATIADEGTQADLLDLMQTRGELYDLLEYDPSRPDDASSRPDDGANAPAEESPP